MIRTSVVDARRLPADLKAELRRHLEHNGHVYIGRHVFAWRKSKWANPYRVDKDGTREEVIAKYRDHILARPDLLADLHELRGKTLVCWCKPEACHGDVLAEFVAELEARP